MQQKKRVNNIILSYLISIGGLVLTGCNGEGPQFSGSSKALHGSKTDSALQADCPVTSSQNNLPCPNVDITEGPGSVPGAGGTGNIDEVYTVSLINLTVPVATASSFSFRANDPIAGKDVQVVIPLPAGNQCREAAARSAANRTKLAVMGRWNTIRLSGFSGDTYNFVQVDYCYSGDLSFPDNNI